ncbi:MAG: DedA family protein [Steroidobacteraceae bacterium]|nr:DedA family protein [Steroidobacteraceae bacterium]
MEALTWLVGLAHVFIDFVLHLDRHLVELLEQFGPWIYAILFLIIFAETGLVVTPFLPGDSLLFAVGALAAVDTSGTLNAPVASAVLGAAAILGNTMNYSIGRAVGPRAFTGRVRFLKVEYLRQTEAFFERYGGMTIVVSRYMPIVRTFAPFVAGIGRMAYARFQAYNIVGGLSWVLVFIWGGYLFGNIPIIKNNFGIVTIAIVIISIMPGIIAIIRRKKAVV